MSNYATDDDDYGDIPVNMTDAQLREIMDQESQLTINNPGHATPDSRDSLDMLYGTYKGNQSNQSNHQSNHQTNPSGISSTKSPSTQINTKLSFPLAALSPANSNSKNPNSATVTPSAGGNPNRATAMTNFGNVNINRDGFNAHNLGSRGNAAKKIKELPKENLNRFTIPKDNADALSMGIDNTNNTTGTTPIPNDIAPAQPLKVKNNVQVNSINTTTTTTTTTTKTIINNGRPNIQDINSNNSVASITSLNSNHNHNDNNNNNNNNNNDDGLSDKERELNRKIAQIASMQAIDPNHVHVRFNDNNKHKKTYSTQSNKSNIREDSYPDSRRETNISTVSTIYDRDSTIARSSTSGVPGGLKNQLSFGKLDLVQDNKQQEPQKSALSAAIKQQRGGDDENNDLNNNSKKSQQFKDKDGNLVIQQLPFNQKKMFKCHLWLEISEEDIVACIVYFDKIWKGEEFIKFIKSEFNAGALSNASVELWVADEDGDIDDDYPPIEDDQILAKTGLEYFYLKIGDDVDKQQRLTMATSVRQSMMKMNSIDLPTVDEFVSDTNGATVDPHRQTNADTRAAKGCCIIM